MIADRQAYSRFQILDAGREAWRDGEGPNGHDYYYDGMSFWRLETNGKKRRLPSWRTPQHGWRHDKACACDLCSQSGPAKVLPLSVA